MFKTKLFVLIVLATMIALPVFASNHDVSTPAQLAPTGFERVCSTDPTVASGGLAGCINRIYLLSLGIGAIFAVLMITLAGYKYMTAQGNSQQVENAKESFASAFIGLIVLFIAFILLNAINPDLVRFQDFSDITTSLPIPEDSLTAPAKVSLRALPNPAVAGQDEIKINWSAPARYSCKLTRNGPRPGEYKEVTASNTSTITDGPLSEGVAKYALTCFAESVPDINRHIDVNVKLNE